MKLVINKNNYLYEASNQLGIISNKERMKVIKW